MEKFWAAKKGYSYHLYVRTKLRTYSMYHRNSSVEIRAGHSDVGWIKRRQRANIYLLTLVESNQGNVPTYQNTQQTCCCCGRCRQGFRGGFYHQQCFCFLASSSFATGFVFLASSHLYRWASHPDAASVRFATQHCLMELYLPPNNCTLVARNLQQFAPRSFWSKSENVVLDHEEVIFCVQTQMNGICCQLIKIGQ